MNKWGLKIGQIWFKSHWPQSKIIRVSILGEQEIEFLKDIFEQPQY
jgi:hypothetical protein